MNLGSLFSNKFMDILRQKILKEDFYIDGFDSADATGFLFDQAHTSGLYKSTLSKLLAEQTSGHTRLTCLKKCVATVTFSGVNPGAANNYYLRLYNSSNVQIKVSSEEAQAGQFGNVALTMIMEVGDYIVSFGGVNPSDSTSVTMAATAIEF